VYAPANPLWVLEAAFERRGLRGLLLAAVNRAVEDQAFLQSVLNNRDYQDYWHLVSKGIPGDLLLQTCGFFHALAQLIESAAAEYKHGGGLLRKGRPSDFYPLFQIVCWMLANRYGRGRQFRENFCNLGFLVFNKKISVESYHTTLKRARRLLRAVN
jgi:hypothetical protein